jgi:hypothetical protein
MSGISFGLEKGMRKMSFSGPDFSKKIICCE